VHCAACTLLPLLGSTVQQSSYNVTVFGLARPCTRLVSINTRLQFWKVNDADSLQHLLLQSSRHPSQQVIMAAVRIPCYLSRPDQAYVAMNMPPVASKHDSATLCMQSNVRMLTRCRGYHGQQSSHGPWPVQPCLAWDCVLGDTATHRW